MVEELTAHLCRWCIARQVKTKGDICHVCADGVEAIGLEFQSDKGFPVIRLIVIAIGFLLSIAIFKILT